MQHVNYFYKIKGNKAHSNFLVDLNSFRHQACSSQDHLEVWELENPNSCLNTLVFLASFLLATENQIVQL